MEHKLLYDKAVRLAVIALLRRDGHVITSEDVVEWFDVGMRTAQRDVKKVKSVISQLELSLYRLSHPAPIEPTYSMSEVAKLIGLNYRHIIFLRGKLNLAIKVKNEWRFKQSDIEALRNRPNSRQR